MPDPSSSGRQESPIHDLHPGIPEELAAIAHDLNQPLTAILGNAQAASRFISAGEINRDELQTILKDIIQDTKRAGEMIRDLQNPASTRRTHG